MKKLFSLLVVLMSQMAYGQSANSIFIDKFDGTNFQEVELAAPGSDRIVFWDHSALNPSYLTLGTGLSISGTTLNASATGGGTWGSITGTLADQTDLQSALGTKQALDSDLTAIAGLTTTSFGRSVLEVADAAGLRTLAGLVYDVGATADTLVMRDNNGAIYAESFAQIEATGGAAAVLRGTVLEFYNVAQDGYIGLLPPALVTSDALSVTLPGESGTLALLSDLAGYLTTADAASAYQPLDTQLTSLAGMGYTGNAGKFIRVNGGETGFELATVGGVALGDSPTWTGTHTFASGVVNVYDKLALKTTGQAGDATAFEVITDPANPAVRALRILPPANSNRVYIGKSGQAAYALNLQYCSNIEWCPPIDVTSNGIRLGSSENTSISRSADGTQIGANHPGDGGLTIYHDASYASIAASQLVARIHRTSGISFYGTNTSATSYERVSMAYDSGNTCYYIDTQKGAAGGTARAFEIRTDGTTRVRVSADGEIFLFLPTFAGTSGSLYNYGGTVMVAP